MLHNVILYKLSTISPKASSPCLYLDSVPTSNSDDVRCRFLNRETFGQTVLLLSSSLLVTNISLVLTNERTRMTSDVACVALAMFRHFAILHQLLAVCVYACHIVTAITCRTHKEHVTWKHFMLKGTVMAYGTWTSLSRRCWHKLVSRGILA